MSQQHDLHQGDHKNKCSAKEGQHHKKYCAQAPIEIVVYKEVLRSPYVSVDVQGWQKDA